MTQTNRGRYLVDLVERVASTAAQAFLAALVASDWLSVPHLRDLSLVQQAGLAGIAAGLSAVKGIVARWVAVRGTASLGPGV